MKKYTVRDLGWKINRKNLHKRAGIDDCYYCGLHHKQVECGGIYHCPNPRCTGPGGAWFRFDLKSYKEVENDRHTVDPKEWNEAANKYILNLLENKKVVVPSEPSIEDRSSAT